MKGPSRTTLLTVGAALLSLAALLVTARTLADTPRALAQIARRRGDLLQLQGLAERHAANRAAVQTLATATQPVPDIGAWLREQQPGWTLDVRDRETTPLLDGWSVRRVDVRVQDVTLADAARGLAGAEALRPPWRAVELQVVAGPTPGQGQLNLVLETLVRTNNEATP